MRNTLFVLFLLIVPGIHSEAQKCDPLPVSFYTVNQKEFKAGDTVCVTITNKDQKALYYFQCDPGCYFRCKSSKGKPGMLDSMLCGNGGCMTDTIVKLPGKLEPGQTISIRCLLPAKGHYLFVFNTNYSGRVTSKRWRCLNMDIYVK